MIKACRTIGLGFALGAVACGGSDGSEDFLEEEPIESVADAVRDGTEGGGVGAVEIESAAGPCSASTCS